MKRYIKSDTSIEQFEKQLFEAVKDASYSDMGYNNLEFWRTPDEEKQQKLETMYRQQLKKFSAWFIQTNFSENWRVFIDEDLMSNALYDALKSDPNYDIETWVEE